MKFIQNLHNRALHRWYQRFFGDYRELQTKTKRESYQRWAVFTVIE